MKWRHACLHSTASLGSSCKMRIPLLSVDDDGVSQEIMFREGFPTATGRENSFRPTSYRPTRCRTMIFRCS